MVAAGDVRWRHHLRLKVRGAVAWVRVRCPRERGLLGDQGGKEPRAGRPGGDSGAQRRRSPIARAGKKQTGQWRADLVEVTGPQCMEMERPPGGIGNEVLESETPAEMRAGMCVGILGGDEDGDLGGGNVGTNS